MLYINKILQNPKQLLFWIFVLSQAYHFYVYARRSFRIKGYEKEDNNLAAFLQLLFLTSLITLVLIKFTFNFPKPNLLLSMLLIHFASKVLWMCKCKFDYSDYLSEKNYDRAMQKIKSKRLIGLILLIVLLAVLLIDYALKKYLVVAWSMISILAFTASLLFSSNNKLLKGKKGENV